MATGKRSALIKYNFQLGEVVLCFEPDPTKARVLYDAKILETALLKAKAGHDLPAYRIHFQGWNSSWDRTVGENYILKSSEDNKQLMKKLAETAKCYRNNRLRKIKINDILEKAFKHKPLVFDVEADVDDGNDSDSSNNSHRKNAQNGTNNKDEMSGNESDDDFEVELTIPKILREKLEEDFLMINKRNKLLRVPAEPNVISVLEGYVKNFSINILYGLSDRWKFVAGSKHSSPDIKSIPLCREVVDGIRICFDFTLPTVLLYRFEKDQFSSFINQQCSNGQNSYSKTTSKRKYRKNQRNKVQKQSKNCSEPSHRNTENSIDSDGLNTAEMMNASTSSPTASSPVRPFCRRVTRQYLAETSKALREMRQRSRPGMRGRGRRKFRDCGFKRQNGQRKMSGRGGGRRGRRPLVRSNHQDLGESGVCEEPKMDCGKTALSLEDTQEKQEDVRGDFSDIKTEPLNTTPTATSTVESTANDCNTTASAMLSTSFSTAALTTTTTTTTMITTTTTSATIAAAPSGASSQDCTLSAPPPVKVEAVQSMSSSSGPHPHHLTMFNAGSAASSVSSMPQFMDFDKGWPYHNLVKEVFHTPAAQSRIDEILSWKLLPPNVYSDYPQQPSLVCGPHQLLRLFVKLPELLGKMDLPDMKLNILVHYLENFLEYLASRHEDFFPISAYVDAV